MHKGSCCPIHPHGLSLSYVDNCLVCPTVVPMLPALFSHLFVSFVHTCQCQSVLIVVVVNRFVLLTFVSPLNPHATNALLGLTCLFFVFFICMSVLLWLCAVVLFNLIFLP